MSREKDPADLRIHSRFFLPVTLLPVVFIALFLLIPLVSHSASRDPRTMILVWVSTAILLLAVLYLSLKGDLNADVGVQDSGSEPGKHT